MTDRFARDTEIAIADLALAGTPATVTGRTVAPRCVFLTGATGFLGVTVLAGLLMKTKARALCLVRASGPADAQSRLEQAFLAATGRPLPPGRAEAVCGDLALPRLGMAPTAAERVAQDADMAIHCGAEVNWSKSYAALRAVNVLSVVEVARLCCERRPKPLIFVSTLAVCYAHGAPERVDEDVDMSRYLAGMPLAYAKGKCVAEHVLGAFGRAGLPVTIVRSGLIVGDSGNGRSNPDDLVSRLLCSAARTGVAPDVDWQVDACPVDFVADALVELAWTGHTGARILHVHHPFPRHWREIVAWLNVAGYQSALVPYDDWLDHVRHATPKSDPDLRPLRPFFLARPRILSGQTLPELYFEANRERIEASRSRAVLSRCGLRVPTIDGEYLARCVGALAASGHIPDAPYSPPKRRLALAAAETTIAALLRNHFGAADLKLKEIQRCDVDGGIISELLGWRMGQEAGVAKYRVAFRRRRGAPVEELPLILKRKPGDELVLAIGGALASACGATLGKMFRANARGLGLLRAHEREPALYRLAEPRLRNHMPGLYGSMRESGGQLFALAIECLDSAAFPSWAEPGRSWPHQSICAVVDSAAQIHSVFLGRTRPLERKTWHVPSPAPDEMRPLWHGLADHAAEFFSDWWGESSLPLQRRAAETARRRRNALAAMPRTLVHNDFNPRNLAFRPGGTAPRPCAFDWELAAVRVPQHDLAELLCFVLPDEAKPETIIEYLEMHRAKLQPYAGIPLDRRKWFEGFGMSLDELILERFPLYALFHRIRRQPYLPRVLQNWRRLHEWFDPSGKSNVMRGMEAIY
jgi:thioester reductase-like protein